MDYVGEITLKKDQLEAELWPLKDSHLLSI